MVDKYRETAARIIDVVIATMELTEVDEKTRFATEDKIVEILRTKFYR